MAFPPCNTIIQNFSQKSNRVQNFLYSSIGLWKRFLRLTGPVAGGFLSLTATLRLRVVVSPAAMSMKSALREYLPAELVILSRRRRISVRRAFETSVSKYRFGGKKPPPVAFFPLWCLTAPPSPRCIGRATKGKRLYGQARRLTSPGLHILCRMCTVDNKAPIS